MILDSHLLTSSTSNDAPPSLAQYLSTIRPLPRNKPPRRLALIKSRPSYQTKPKPPRRMVLIKSRPTHQTQLKPHRTKTVTHQHQQCSIGQATYQLNQDLINVEFPTEWVVKSSTDNHPSNISGPAIAEDNCSIISDLTQDSFSLDYNEDDFSDASSLTSSVSMEVEDESSMEVEDYARLLLNLTDSSF